MAACEPHSCAGSPASSGLGKVQIASSTGEGSLVASSSQLGNQQEGAWRFAGGKALAKNNRQRALCWAGRIRCESVISFEEQCCPQAWALELGNYLARMLYDVKKSSSATSRDVASLSSSYLRRRSSSSSGSFCF